MKMPQTGATRHQKFKKSEKSKTKLKAKKKDLPKGTNVTKTDFKVKKIIIREQLKKHGENEALSKRKLNLKELLTRLNHFNTNARVEALNGIKEIVTTYPDVLEHNLGQLILGVTPLLTNMEKAVRQEAQKVLHLILSNTSKENMYPFFDVMSTYLRSSMTHIDMRIKEDSLQFFDMLLACCPEKVVEGASKIIPNMMRMICSLTNSTFCKPLININTNNQISTLKWRVNVMQRLGDFFTQYVKHYNLNDEKNDVIQNKHIFDASKKNFYSLFQPIYTSTCQVSCFTANNLHDDANLFDEVTLVQTHGHSLISLLLEVWLEACPKEASSGNIETIISEDDASLLKNVLNVLSIIMNIVHRHKMISGTSLINYSSFKSNHNNLLKHLFNSFPYITRAGKKRASKLSVDEANNKDPNLIAENLEICHIYLKLNNFFPNSYNEQLENAMLNYIEQSLTVTSSDSITEIVNKIIETLLSKVDWSTKNVLTIFFEKLVTNYVNSPNKSFKYRLFPLLCDLYSTDFHIYTIPAYKMWLKQLPDIFLEESITTANIDSLHSFAMEHKKLFNSILKPKLTEIVKNLPLIKVVDDRDSVSHYKLFSLLYWVKCWNNESLNLLEQQLTDSAYKNDHGKYIFDTLHLRAGGMLQEFCAME